MNSIYPWQQAAWKHLAQLLEQSKLPHAILLSGPHYCGLGRLGEQLQALLVCQQPDTGKPCGQCLSCRLLSAGNHPDAACLRVEDGSTEIRIHQVRNLIHQITLTPSISQRKVALIQPADAMNKSSANALLKTLEEPAGHSVLILLSNDPQRLLPTIRSRCQQLPVPAPANDQAGQWLKDNYPDQLQELLDEALNAAQGMPMLAVRYLESDLLSQRKQVARDLQALVRQQEHALSTAQRWADLPCNELWLWLSGWCGSLARKQVVSGGNVAGIHLSATELLDLQKLALESWRLCDTPLRQDLLLTDWLLIWSGKH